MLLTSTSLSFAVFKDGCEVSVQMRREPVGWPQAIQALSCSDTAQFPGFGIGLETSLVSKEPLMIAMPFDALWPVMRKTYVNLRAKRQQFSNIQFPNMIYASDLFPIVGKSFVVRSAVVVAFPDSRQAGNSEWPEANDIGSTEVVDIWRNPAAVVELEKVIAGFVVAPNEDCQIRCCSRPAVVFMKVRHSPILLRHGGDIEVKLIPDSLMMV